MKKLMFIAAAALAMAACSKEQTLDTNKGTAIGFNVSAGTRATAKLMANDIDQIPVKAFRADGTQYFYDTFTKDSEGNFQSATPYYWLGEETLTFYSCLPNYLNDLTAGKTVDFTTDTTIANQVDFVAVKATGTSANEATGVALTFQHRLAGVQVTAVENKAGYEFKIKSVKIGNVMSKGIYHFDAEGTDPLWTAQSTQASFSETFADSVTLNGTAQALISGVGAMLVPQKLTAWDKTAARIGTQNYIAVELQINIVQGEGEEGVTPVPVRYYPAATGEGAPEYAWAYIPVDTNWEAGKIYTYALNFATGAGYDGNGNLIFGKPIFFTVDVADWTDVAQEIELDDDLSE